MITRRDLLTRAGLGFGAVGLSAVTPLTGNGTQLAPDREPLEPRAKHLVFLFLNGGLSHVDTFDPKPALSRYHGKPLPIDTPRTERRTGHAFASPFDFKQYGQSGLPVSDLFPRVGQHIDKFCVIRSMTTDVPNHEPSLFMMNSGQLLPGHPALGCWTAYGLGSENLNLPSFIVLCPGLPTNGAQLWSAGYLPSAYQGTHIWSTNRPPKELIRYSHNSSWPPGEQRKSLDALYVLNRLHLERRGGGADLDSSIEAMETAFRMQVEAPDAFDITQEPERVRRAYGTTDFGRSCLMARRLVERGVRVVQVYFGHGQPWDSHDDIFDHRRLAGHADPAIAAFIGDLADRGLLEETIVLVGGEFGRTPTVEVGGLVKVHNGRDHNSHGFTILAAGGGFAAGRSYGATDEFGFRAVENPLHPHDLHATVLHLLGLDHRELTFRHSGRDFRLTDTGGRVVQELLA